MGNQNNTSRNNSNKNTNKNNSIKNNSNKNTNKNTNIIYIKNNE